MLTRRPSLQLRAAAIFVAVFATVFVAGFVLFSWRSLAAGGERHHAGPTIALSLAADAVRLHGDTLVLPDDGALADIARANPHFWLFADIAGHHYRHGDVPAAAERLLVGDGSGLGIARFHVRGIDRPLSDASVVRQGGALFAAGGIDPSTITLAHALHYLFREGLLLIVVGVGVVATTALLVAVPLLTAALRPLVADAVAVGPDDPDHRIGERRVPGELLPLVRSFNAALDRLSDELGRRRRFVTDVAHELRTPLAIVSLQAEALPPGPARTELQRVVTRMVHLVGQMLDVERLSLAARRPATIDLVALAKDVVGEMAPLAIASGYELGLRAPACPVQVPADANAITRALTNLVANAVAHGGGRGEISVIVGGDATVDVVDEGPGVPLALRGHLFEPFSRERWDRDGCGLGLHLTREIMRAHGGDAELLESTRGAAFRLRFARSDAPSLTSAGTRAGMPG